MRGESVGRIVKVMLKSPSVMINSRGVVIIIIIIIIIEFL